MAALSTSRESATVLDFPGPAPGNAAAVIGAALKAHRLPELLAAQLLRAAGGATDPHTALAGALAARMTCRPLDLRRTRGILLVGACGAGKSIAARAIAAAAAREVLLMETGPGLAGLRGGDLPRDVLVVMEAQGFHPLNPKARGAFAALNDIEGVETLGVISAAGDAADVGETVAAFRFKRIIVTGLDRTRRLGALVAGVTGGASLAQIVRAGRLEGLDSAALAAALLAPTSAPTP